jgi:cyclopropane-fatty-acyl-phospholipid synthase
VDGIEVDTGFMVYNSLNYPNLVSLFEEIGVQGEDTTMGFSVSADNGKFEYAAGETLTKLFATRSNLLNPYFYMMVWEILRFNKLALKFLELPEFHADRKFTAGEFLKKNKFSDYFVRRYLVPMTAAIWSSSNQGILTFPAITLFTFLNK